MRSRSLLWRFAVDAEAKLSIQSEIDPADEKLGARIRKAKVLKIPYILVVGDDDVAAGTVGVNRRGSGAPERGVSLVDFTELLEAEIATTSYP